MSDKLPHSVLPIPGKAYTGLIKYDAKDPEAKFPPIEPATTAPAATAPKPSAVESPPTDDK